MTKCYSKHLFLIYYPCFEYHTIKRYVVETPILLWKQYFLTCGELDIDFYFVLQYNKKRNFKGD